jgi:O-succinylbenzoate synthase
MIQYIEEPLQEPLQLPQFAAATGGFPYALDKSLSDGVWQLHQLQLLAPHCKALVLKPTVCGGYEATLQWAVAAQQCGIAVVISCAFESCIGLAHLAILASIVSDSTVAHGLSTLTDLQRCVLSFKQQYTLRLKL